MAIEKDLATCATALTRIADALETLAERSTADEGAPSAPKEKTPAAEKPKSKKAKPAAESKPGPEQTEDPEVTYEMVREKVLAYNKIHGAAKGRAMMADLAGSDMKLPDIVEKAPEVLPKIMAGFEKALAESEEE